MTLHLHILIWISGYWSPQRIREKLCGEDNDFKRELIEYLESCQTGSFLTGTIDQVKERVMPLDGSPSYDPTVALPRAPPKTACNDFTTCDCELCGAVRHWVNVTFPSTVDNIVYRSNRHKCFMQKDGCINKDGVCTARFPRPIFQETVVDKDGRIALKKLESSINTISPVISYGFACNTDATSLSSGTAVAATAGYVTDYLVKMGVKTHQIFSSVYDVFERNPDVWTESKSRSDAARRLILKMANSLTSKMEIGGPMAAMYLIGNPDHYSSHSFVSFYWKSVTT
ncbi:hypothetical protein DFP72DRAFT_801048 [Ephemerocybe angulata]|uniref:Uncharacterized protein n=1 Tax=Ephemerocybe angulata TaxID=980116 RepID=A0A8H6ID63_9AGAR|nr:hypothetical protein DFP72DRAFT_801048 [Tulosesus angulatus]